MKTRILVALVGVPALFALLLLAPAWATLLLTCAMTGVAAYEMIHTACPKTPLAAYVLTILAAVLQMGARFTGTEVFAVGAVSSVTIIRLAFVMLLFLMAVLTYGKESGVLHFQELCVCALSGIVLPAFYGCIFLLRQAEPFGKVYVLAPFFIAFVGDSFSMFAGMLFGGPKMAPRVSPKKTWAGGIGGPVGSALGMLLLGLLASKLASYPPNYGLLALLGVLANLFGQLGDLSMSVIKREVGIKDYSRLFLEHGGMLDRFDSTLFIAPVVWLFVTGGLL